MKRAAEELSTENDVPPEVKKRNRRQSKVEFIERVPGGLLEDTFGLRVTGIRQELHLRQVDGDTGDLLALAATCSSLRECLRRGAEAERLWQQRRQQDFVMPEPAAALAAGAGVTGGLRLEAFVALQFVRRHPADRARQLCSLLDGPDEDEESEEAVGVEGVTEGEVESGWVQEVLGSGFSETQVALLEVHGASLQERWYVEGVVVEGDGESWYGEDVDNGELAIEAEGTCKEAPPVHVRFRSSSFSDEEDQDAEGGMEWPDIRHGCEERAARDDFRHTVTVISGDIAALPFAVDALICPTNELFEDRGGGPCHTLYKGAGLELN
eukprot:gene10185-12050_t